MIYLKTSIGIELRGEDMLLSSLQSNLSPAAFTHFKRIASYKLMDKEALRREINHFFKSNRLPKDNVVLGIPRRDIVLRYLDLPAEVADNLKQVVRYQVQSFEPTDEDKFYYDYVRLNAHASSKRLSILLAMIRKTLLDEHLQLLRSAGIRPGAVIGSSMGLANMFLQNRKGLHGKTFVLADVGSSAFEILALRNGSIAYSREAFKENEESWKSLILRELNEAAAKMRLGPDGSLEKIVLAGESSEAARSEIGEEIPDCELLKNTVECSIPNENKAHFQEAASTLGLALTGLARRPVIGMNLLPDELRVRQRRWAYIPTIIFCLAIIALIVALGFHGMVQNRALIRELDRIIEANKPAVDRVQSLRAQSEALETKIKYFEAMVQKRDMNLEILRELTTILTPDTFLQNYTNKDGNIQITGYSSNSSDVIPNLVKSPLLKDVKQRGMSYLDPQKKK